MAHIFIGDYSLYELAAYFYAYAFLGWCAEVVFAAAKTGKFVNRGFLNGPLCPIYGAGVVLLLVCLSPLKKWFWAVFLGAALLCSVLEFLTGFALEKIFHRKWWDYSDRPFNLIGYVCLSMSLLWGAAALAVVYAVQPAIEALVDRIPVSAGYIILGIFAALTAVDLVFTLLQISSLGKKYRQLERVNKVLRAGSDTIGSVLSAATLKGGAAVEKIKESGAYIGLRGRLEEIRYRNAKRRDAVYDKIEKSRLAKAFPSLAPNPERRARIKRQLRAYEEKAKADETKEDTSKKDKDE